MEQPAGRSLVQETIDEALSFRRAMTATRKQLKGSWWFDVWQPDAMAEKPTADTANWVLKPGDKWHGFEGLAENHALVDPIKVTILSPGLSADGSMQAARHSGGGRRPLPVVPPHRDREDRALFVPGPVLDGHHQRQVEHAGHRAAELQGSLRLQRADPPRAAGAGRGASRGLREDGPEGPVRGDPQGLSRRQGAAGAEGHVHRAARDGDAAGGCL